MAARPEIVVTGIRFGEGPVWCPAGAGPLDEDTLVVTSVVDGALYRVWPEAQRFELLAVTGGGANGAALASDGSVLVTQNGGIDFAAMGVFAEPPPPAEPAEPGLQLAAPDGTVRYLAGPGTGNGSFHAPNDLVVDGEGTVYFTDPGHFPPPEPPIGRVIAYEPDGTTRVVASDFWYCNGIALDRDGHLVVVERTGLQRVFPDGSREWVVEMLGRGGADGFCLDADGRFYVASPMDHGVRVVDPDGTVVDFLEIPGDGITTNCCFGGPDGRSLYATDAIPGNVVVWPDLPVQGMPLHLWPAPDEGPRPA
jgi:gluconolactonase